MHIMAPGLSRVDSTLLSNSGPSLGPVVTVLCNLWQYRGAAGATQVGRLQVATRTTARPFFLKTNSQKGSEDTTFPRGAHGNTYMKEWWLEPRSLWPGNPSRTPHRSRLSSCSDHSTGNSAKEPAGFEFHLTKCLTRSKATTMKKPNVKMRQIIISLISSCLRWHSKEFEFRKHTLTRKTSR